MLKQVRLKKDIADSLTFCIHIHRAKAPNHSAKRNTLKGKKTFHFYLLTFNFLIIFAPNFGLTSGENRECCSELTTYNFKDMESLVKFVQDEFVTKKELPNFSAGDTITVYYEIKEGNKTRTQFFRGTVIQRRGSGASETFTIRKMSGSIGVERIFPVNLPALQKIEVNKRGKVRRARIFYFRGLTGKKARIKEARR